MKDITPCMERADKGGDVRCEYRVPRDVTARSTRDGGGSYPRESDEELHELGARDGIVGTEGATECHDTMSDRILEIRDDLVSLGHVDEYILDIPRTTHTTVSRYGEHPREEDHRVASRETIVDGEIRDIVRVEDTMGEEEIYFGFPCLWDTAERIGDGRRGCDRDR